MPDDLAAQIRDRRHELGLTQAQLAELVGRSPSTIGAWETGRSRPADEETVDVLVRVLDLDAIDTAERIPPPPPRPAPPAQTANGHTAPAERVEPTPVASPPAEVVAGDATEAPAALPVRTDTDPLYRVRLVATVAAIVVLGWVFVASIGAAGEVLGAMTETLLAPFRG